MVGNSVNAINRLPHGVTYCVSEYGGNFKVNWKCNNIILTAKSIDSATSITNKTLLLCFAF